MKRYKSLDPELRKAVLERDNYECQLAKIFGVSHIPKVPCHESLEVHHKTYERYGQERPEDLITVCKRCHKFLTSYIRKLRYGRQSGDIVEIPETPKLPTIIERKKEHGNVEVQNYRRITPAPAQRLLGRSSEQVDTVD